MREIKFRGKRVCNGEWAHGSLICYESGQTAILDTPFSKYGHEATEIIRRTQVDPASVGQYTGLRSRNGKEIYEYDIMQMYHHSDDTNKHEKDYISAVHYHHGAFHVENPRYKIEQTFLHMARPGQSFEVIGNIYDNPELLEVEQ